MKQPYKSTLTIWYEASIMSFTDCWRDKDGNIGYYDAREYKFHSDEQAREFAVDSMNRGAVKASISHAF